MSNEERRFGARSQKELDELVEYVKLGLSPKEIAEKMGRRLIIIKKWIKQLHLGAISNNEQAGDINRLLKVLHSKYYWKEICYQFTEEEIKYFESTWISLMLQFKENVLPAEEIQIKQLATIEILINRSMRERKTFIEQIDDLQKEINTEYKLPPDARDVAKITSLETAVAYAKNAIIQYTGEYTKLLGEQKKINESLKATRDQRIKRIEDSKSTFAGLLRMLDEEDQRRRMGDDAELMKLAKDKAKEKLSEIHIFADHQGDYPILTPETMDKIQDD